MQPIECDFCGAEPSEATVTRKNRGVVRSRLRLCRRCVDLQQYVAIVQGITTQEAIPCLICGQPGTVEGVSRNRNGQLLGRAKLCRTCANTAGDKLISMLRVSNLWTPGILELPSADQRI